MNNLNSSKGGSEENVHTDGGKSMIQELQKRIEPREATLKIILTYLIVGILWIVFSDGIISSLVEDKELLTSVQTYKGWAYVFITAFIFYLIILDKMKLFKLSNDRIYDTYLELASTHRKLRENEKVLHDQISLLRESRKDLKKSKKKLEIIVQGSNDGIWHWDFKTGESFFSLPYKEDYGFSKDDERSSQEIMTLITLPDYKEKRSEIFSWHRERGKEFLNYTFKVQDKYGNYRWIASKGKIEYDDEGHAVYAAGSHTDITEEKLMEEKLYQLAYYDSLTKLPNKSHLEKRIGELTGDFKTAKEKFGLAFINIDGFRNINETMGYKAGDSLILYIARLIAETIKSPNELFRFGGDAFAIIFRDMSKEEIGNHVTKIINKARTPWLHKNQTFPFTISVGISIYPNHGEDFDTLLQNADLALSYAKQTGKNKLSIYNREMTDIAWKYMEMNNELRLALEKKEFKLYYQPQIDLKTNEIIGAEALIRWIHPEKGLISPMAFIPFAEKTGQIINIDNWVLKQVCNQKRQWIDKGCSPIKLSVNFSASTLMQESLAEKIQVLLEKHAIPQVGLEVEITETSIMVDIERTIKVLKEIKDLGLSIALDDFGSGYSSLTYVRHLPVDILKIDRNFISEIPGDSRNSFITKTIIDLGHFIGFKVLAEGIETEEQVIFLKENNCDYGQGFNYFKPMSAEELEKLLM